ncbi:hypothetical protein FKM82_022612 [Ascaphus truei]
MSLLESSYGLKAGYGERGSSDSRRSPWGYSLWVCVEGQQGDTQRSPRAGRARRQWTRGQRGSDLASSLLFNVACDIVLLFPYVFHPLFSLPPATFQLAAREEESRAMVPEVQMTTKKSTEPYRKETTR